MQHCLIKNDSNALKKGRRCFIVMANAIVKVLLSSGTSHKPVNVGQVA